MKTEIIEFMRIAANGVRLTATQEAALQKKLIAVSLDPLFLAMDLERAQKLFRGEVAETMRSLLKKMTLAQLKKTSKAWNPHRLPITAETDLIDLRGELEALLAGTLEPTSKAVKKKSARKS